MIQFQSVLQISTNLSNKAKVLLRMSSVARNQFDAQLAELERDEK